MICKSWYTKKRLREKLISEGYPENDVEEALQAFEQDGYIDDEFFMKTYLEGKRNSNPRGFWAYKTELERLGIEKDLLEQFRSIYFPLPKKSKMESNSSGNGFNKVKPVGIELSNVYHERDLVTILPNGHGTNSKPIGKKSYLDLIFAHR